MMRCPAKCHYLYYLRLYLFRRLLRSQNTVTVSISINRMTLQAYNCSINSILRIDLNSSLTTIAVVRLDHMITFEMLLYVHNA